MESPSAGGATPATPGGLAAAAAELEAWRARAEAAEADAADARKREHVAKSQATRALALAEKAEGDFKRQKELLQAAITRQAAYQRDAKALADEMEGYRHKHEVAERELGVARAECERLGQRVVDTTRAVAQRESDAASVASTLKHQVATLLYEVENERAQRKAAEERVPALAKQAAEAKERLRAREAAAVEAVSAKDKAIEALETQLKEAREVRVWEREGVGVGWRITARRGSADGDASAPPRAGGQGTCHNLRLSVKQLCSITHIPRPVISCPHPIRPSLLRRRSTTSGARCCRGRSPSQSCPRRRRTWRRCRRSWDCCGRGWKRGWRGKSRWG
jgi:ParB family chromosome partitioning protein